MKVLSVNTTTNALAGQKTTSKNVNFGAKLTVQPIVKKFIVSSLEKNAKTLGSPIDTPKFTKTAEDFLVGIAKRINNLEPKDQEIILDIRTQAKRGMSEPTNEINNYAQPVRLSLKGSNPEKYLKNSLDGLLPLKFNADEIVFAASKLLTLLGK